jgi:hypothetical protein
MQKTLIFESFAYERLYALYGVLQSPNLSLIHTIEYLTLFRSVTAMFHEVAFKL